MQDVLAVQDAVFVVFEPPLADGVGLHCTTVLSKTYACLCCAISLSLSLSLSPSLPLCIVHYARVIVNVPRFCP